MKNLPIAILILAVRLSAVALHAEPAKMMKASRLEALVDANIKATQAFESLDAKKLGDEVRLKYWNVGGLSDAALNRLIELQKEMMAQPLGERSQTAGECLDYVVPGKRTEYFAAAGEIAGEFATDDG